MTRTTKEYTPQQILSLPMEENDANADTIGQYFASLLHTLFVETEGFSGKRPFGNSGWETDVDKALIKADAVWGRLDGDGWIEDYDSAAASAIVFDTIAFLSKADWNTLTLPVEPTDWYVVYLDIDGYGSPTISDYFSGGLTKKEAELKAEENNLPFDSNPWRVVQISS